MWLDEVLDTHIHDHSVAGHQLLVQRVAEVDPKILTILVQVTQTKVVLLQDAQVLAHLCGSKTSVTTSD